MVGIQSHGQGLETTLAQIAYEELGIDPAKISVRHGDTGLSPFGIGTIASRSIVMAGGAVAHTSRLLREKILKIGAHLLQCESADVRCAGGKVVGRAASVGIDEVARVAHLRMEALPQGVEPLLDASPRPISPGSTPASFPTPPMPRSSRSIRRPARSSSSTSPSRKTAAP